MTWQAPAALAALLLMAGPILVHLLMRRHARRVLFPGTRFVPPAQGAAVRPRRVSDSLLLSVRCAAVAASALAVAQPLLITGARRQAWAARVARAVVVDVSPSVDATLAAELSRAELGSADASQRIASADLSDAVVTAVAWLGGIAAGTREVVVVSDFQSGSLAAGDLVSVPSDVGVRFVRAGKPSVVRDAVPMVEGWRGGRWTASIAPDPTATGVIWDRSGDARPLPVTILAGAADRVAAERARAAAESPGVTAAERPRPIEIAFAGAAPTAGGMPSTPWIVSAGAALAAAPPAGAPLTVTERSGVLVASTSLSGTSPLAPNLIRAVMMAASPVLADRELEPGTIDEGMLARWQRAPLPQVGVVPPGAADGRWLWAVALLLLAIEGALRIRAARPATEGHARAA